MRSSTIRSLRERDPVPVFLYDEIMSLNPPRDPELIGALGALAPGGVAVLRDSRTGYRVYFEPAAEFNRQLSRFLVDAGWGNGI